MQGAHSPSPAHAQCYVRREGRQNSHTNVRRHVQRHSFAQQVGWQKNMQACHQHVRNTCQRARHCLFPSNCLACSIQHVTNVQLTAAHCLQQPPCDRRCLQVSAWLAALQHCSMNSNANTSHHQRLERGGDAKLCNNCTSLKQGWYRISPQGGILQVCPHAREHIILGCINPDNKTA